MIYKKFIDPSSLKFSNVCEWVPGRTNVEETYVNGVLKTRSVTRSIQPMFEIGSAMDLNAKRLSYEYLPVIVECEKCGWRGFNSELKSKDNGEEPYYEYDNEDESGINDNENYKVSNQVCPHCNSWYCLDVSGKGKDIDFIHESIESFKERFDIKEGITEGNLEDIKNRIIMKV